MRRSPRLGVQRCRRLACRMGGLAISLGPKRASSRFDGFRGEENATFACNGLRLSVEFREERSESIKEIGSSHWFH